MSKRTAPIDWTDIERDYRHSPKSIRELADWYKVAESGIRARAKRKGWQRECAHDVRADAQAKPSPAPVVYVRQPTVLTAENTDPAVILARGRNLVIRLLDELDATSSNIGEMEATIAAETAEDESGRRRDAMLKAVSLKARADTVKALAAAAKTLAESGAPAGKKAARQAGAAEASSAGIYAVPTPGRRVQ